jgi:N-acetylmuramoyl-L-alanine amidase
VEQLRRDLGLEVLMTRDDDSYLGLQERTEFANRRGADLFISVHCNGWLKRDVGGFETYFLSPAKTDDARAVAAMENAAARFDRPEGESASDLEFILWDMAQNEFLNESSRLAELVQAEMRTRFPELEDRGVKQAGFYVLNGAFMPAILIEVAFISNQEEERLLRSPAFRREASQAISAAVRRFIAYYEGRNKS